MFYNQQCRTGNGYSGKCGGWGNRAWGLWAQKMRNASGSVPANIEESDTNFIISLYAAGLIKENISLKVKDDVLTIAYKAPEANQDIPRDGFTHQEFSGMSFERSFLLNNKVSIEGISAAYNDGILKVTLPKNPETNKPAQDISVA